MTGAVADVGRTESTFSTYKVDLQLGVPPGRTFLNLQIQNLSFMIGNARVLTDCSASMHQGEVVALMGESGSGKTTLLNVIGGRASYGFVHGKHARGLKWEMITAPGDVAGEANPFEGREIENKLLVQEISERWNETKKSPRSVLSTAPLNSAH